MTGSRPGDARVDDLRTLTARLHDLANATPICLARIDPDRRYRYVSVPYAARFGLAPVELGGRALADVMGEEAFRGLAPHLARALSGELVELELELPYAHIGPRSEVHVLTPERGPDGLVRGCILVVRDRSLVSTTLRALERADETVARSTSRFRQLAEVMPHGVWTADADGRVTEYSARVGRLASVEGSAGDLWSQIVHPEDRPRFERAWQIALATATPLSIETRLATDVEGVYRWHLVRALPTGTLGARAGRWFGTSTDIHDQKRAEADQRFLADASAVLGTSIEYDDVLPRVAAVGVPAIGEMCVLALLGPNGQLERKAVCHVDVAREAELELLMLPCEEPSGPMARAVREGRPLLVPPLTPSGAHGAMRPVLIVPLRGRARVLGALAFGRGEGAPPFTPADVPLAEELARRAGDVIENADLHRSVLLADKRKDHFLATLAHELRNPLAAMATAVHLLERPNTPEETARAVRSLGRQTSQLVHLVNDLLDVSRIASGKMELRRETLSLDEVVAEAIETARPHVDANAHRLERVGNGTPTWVHGDCTRLTQVVANLLENAARYTPPGGRITIEHGSRDGRAVLLVRDDGIGIEPHELESIFDPFVQVAPVRLANGGLGLGLAVARGLVEMHGGTVRASSDGAGRGSTFTITLPLADAPAVAPSLASEDPASVPKRRILVVDDNEDAAELLVMALARWGHDVRLAASGAAALSAYEAEAPDVVILDIGLPDMSGLEVARRIRMAPTAQSTRIIAVTGFGQQADKQRSKRAGADHHLVKPVELDELCSLLHGSPC